MPLGYYIGTSGWHYDHWRDRFYPRKLTKAEWLEFYAHHFTTVELNNSFYRLPREIVKGAWQADDTPRLQAIRYPKALYPNPSI